MAVDHVPALGSDVHTFRVVKWTKIAILRLATTMYVLAALRAIQRTGWKQMLIGESHVYFSHVSSMLHSYFSPDLSQLP